MQTRKPRKGTAVIAASMHGFASCRKSKWSVTLTLTLDRVKVKSTYAVHVGLHAGLSSLQLYTLRLKILFTSPHWQYYGGARILRSTAAAVDR